MFYFGWENSGKEEQLIDTTLKIIINLHLLLLCLANYKESCKWYRSQLKEGAGGLEEVGKKI